MKKFFLLSCLMMFFAFSANAQETAKKSCSKSKAACAKTCSKSKTAALTSPNAEQMVAAVLLTGDKVEVSQCSKSNTETRSYTCSKSGSTTTQKICNKSGKVTTTKVSADGDVLSEEVAMLQEGEAVTKEAKVATPAASKKAACCKKGAKASCNKSAGAKACTKAKTTEAIEK